MNGLPSSVKISPNSLITACVELLGSLLTIKYLENNLQSPSSQFCSNRTSQCLKCAMHEEACQSHFQLVWLPWNLLDTFHIFPVSQMSLEMPGQNTEFLALSMHFSIPKCPSCICSNTFLLSVEGRRSLAPFVISPFSIDKSSL